jgi:protein-S-isoprenylcysteine O-methyltransferase Ste14
MVMLTAFCFAFTVTTCSNGNQKKDVTIKPAKSLETTGIYSVSRNPMYLGLLAIYIGMAFLKGNDWTFICIPFVILVIHFYVIRNEEKYLQRTFGNEYEEYKKQVRRWI